MLQRSFVKKEPGGMAPSTVLLSEMVTVTAFGNPHPISPPPSPSRQDPLLAKDCDWPKAPGMVSIAEQ